MRNIYLQLFLAITFFPTNSQAQAGFRQIDHYLQLIRGTFSARSAFQTTAYVSDHWRLPGNAGFDSSIYYVEKILVKAGFTNSDVPQADRMTYRIERRPLQNAAWQPVDASVQIEGENVPLLQFSTNRNMVAINSFSTPEDGISAEVVYLSGCEEADIAERDVKGKIVFAECNSVSLYRLAVKKYGAIGVFSYSIPKYNQPEQYIHAIPFTSIPFDDDRKAWGINLSYAAKERLIAALDQGPLKARVEIHTTIIPAAEELTLIAEIPGALRPEERFVFSAHVQEPGANDNASGVGVLAEMSRVAALLWRSRRSRPARTLTFIWGDEIRATKRFIQEDPKRRDGIRWGMSLDMVGENTEKTGGTFLIEKMPDPSAVWTRGEDRHTEWGAALVTPEDFHPHYFNDIVEAVCRRQARGKHWEVKTNPFEGGSDHQPFLDARIPGLLLWHFTDAFYHTDLDRIDKVSAQTLGHVGSSALACALLLSNGLEETATEVLELCRQAAYRRLEAEIRLSSDAVKKGSPVKTEEKILETWADWYIKALPEVMDILVEAPSGNLQEKIGRSVDEIREIALKGIASLYP